MFRPGTRGAHPGVEALLGRLGLDVLSITFQAHPLKGALRGHQSIHPHNDNTFSIVQLSLSLSLSLLGTELLLQLDGHRRHHRRAWRRRKPTPIDKRESTPRQEASLGNRQFRVKPHLVDDKAQPGAASALPRRDND
jgi:hypothetical protein